MQSLEALCIFYGLVIKIASLTGSGSSWSARQGKKSGSRAHGRSNYNCCELRLALLRERAEIAPPFVSLRRLIIYLFSPASTVAHTLFAEVYSYI